MEDTTKIGNMCLGSRAPRPLERLLSEPQSHCGNCGKMWKRGKSLLLLGLKPKFHCPTAHSLVTILTHLTQLTKTVKNFVSSFGYKYKIIFRADLKHKST
jgi:hypothetical protein